MKIGIIGEGDTEYACLPTMVSKLGHTVVGNHNLCGIGANYPTESLFAKKIYPYVRGLSIKSMQSRPDRVVIVLDRENRTECSGEIAAAGLKILERELSKENLIMPISVVVANRQFECWLLADTTALDGSPLFKDVLSSQIGPTIDEINVLGIIRANLRPSCGWDKPRYGKALAQKLDLTSPEVLSASRSLRKFVKELT
jgi:hypothetical protein